MASASKSWLQVPRPLTPFASPPLPPTALLLLLLLLLQSFLIACMSVTTDRLVSRWPNKSLRIAEMSIAGSALAALLLVPTIWAFDELPQWKQQLPAAVSGPLSSTATRAALIGCSIALPAAKALVRTAKYESIAAVSALGFEFVQAGATLAASLLNVIIFPAREPWSGWYVGAVALLCAAFVAYARARSKERAAVALPERARAATAAFALSSMSESPAPLTLTPMARSHGFGIGVPAAGFSAQAADDNEPGKASRLARRQDAFQLRSDPSSQAQALEQTDTKPLVAESTDIAVPVPVAAPVTAAVHEPQPAESSTAAAVAQDRRGEATLSVKGDGWAEVPL